MAFATTTMKTTMTSRATVMTQTRRQRRRSGARCAVTTATARSNASWVEDAKETVARAVVGWADSLPDEEDVKLLCDAACEKALESKEMVTTKSGLQYKDIVVGDGVEPPVGFQVVVDYIAMDDKGRIFDNSLDKGKPNDIRVVDCVGTGDYDSCTVIPGFDEGLLTMKSGGIRRMYIPGDLAFPKGLASAPGRPKVGAKAPVIFDAHLLYIPGFD
jgi:peptidylprolyl isomerase